MGRMKMDSHLLRHRNFDQNLWITAHQAQAFLIHHLLHILNIKQIARKCYQPIQKLRWKMKKLH